MAGVLPGRRRAVVARVTVSRNSSMIEYRAGPAERTVAVGTLIGAGDVVRRLGRRHRTHVTRRTVRSDAGVVNSGRFPESRQVAIAARGLNGNVVRGGSRSGAAGAAAMAGIAVGRGSFESPPLMAGFAGGARVSSGEGEAARVMVEVRPGCLRFDPGRQQQRRNDEKNYRREYDWSSRSRH